jgi:hypothetical protein
MSSGSCGWTGGIMAAGTVETPLALAQQDPKAYREQMEIELAALSARREELGRRVGEADARLIQIRIYLGHS